MGHHHLKLRQTLIGIILGILIISTFGSISIVGESDDPFDDIVVSDNSDLSKTIKGENGEPSLGQGSFDVEERYGKYRYHLMTEHEVEELKERVGVRDSQQSYNKIINGHGTGLAPPTQSQWSSMIGTANVVDSVNYIDFPSSIDHSTSTYFPIVGSQGGQGSCAAWATTYYANGFLQAKDNIWTGASTGNQAQLMSPAWVYNKVNYAVDEGSYIWENIELIQSVGNARLSTMPYNDADYLSWGDETAWRDAPQFRCGEYFQTDGCNIDVIKAWLNDGYLCPIGIDADTFEVGLDNGDDTMTSTEYDENWLNGGGHAITIIGYDDSKIVDGEAGAFKLVNSWGSNWGNTWGGAGDNGGWSGNGFFWMTYKAVAEVSDPVRMFYDKVDYDPYLLAAWDLSVQGSKESPMTLGIGSPLSPDDTRVPLWDGGQYNFPSFMCLDITEFSDDVGLNNN